MRKVYRDALIDFAKKDDTVIFLTGDLGYEFNKFKEIFPGRYFNFGVCEQSMVSIAAGLALEGLTPFLYSITPFLIERPFEQVKLDIDQQKTNVKLVGYADYPTMGPTHAELNWKEISKYFKNTKFFFPETAEEAKEALIEAYNFKGPAVISLKKAKQREF